MTNPRNVNSSPWPTLSSESELYRAVIKPNHFENGQITHKAFLRRSPHPETGEIRDAEGLSVYLKDKISVDMIILRWKKCVAVGYLTVGNVRNLEADPPLDVIQNKENHANITGLPAYGENDFMAENFASELAKICVCVYQRR